MSAYHYDPNAVYYEDLVQQAHPPAPAPPPPQPGMPVNATAFMHVDRAHAAGPVPPQILPPSSVHGVPAYAVQTPQNIAGYGQHVIPGGLPGGAVVRKTESIAVNACVQCAQAGQGGNCYTNRNTIGCRRCNAKRLKCSFLDGTAAAPSDFDMPDVVRSVELSLNSITHQTRAVVEVLQNMDKRLSVLAERLSGVEERMSGIDQRMSGVEERTAGIDRRTHSLEDNVKAGLAVGERISGFEERFSGLGERMSGLGERMAGFETHMAAFGGRMASMETRLSGLEEGVSEIRAFYVPRPSTSTVRSNAIVPPSLFQPTIRPEATVRPHAQTSVSPPESSAGPSESRKRRRPSGDDHPRANGAATWTESGRPGPWGPERVARASHDQQAPSHERHTQQQQHGPHSDARPDMRSVGPARLQPVHAWNTASWLNDRESTPASPGFEEHGPPG